MCAYRCLYHIYIYIYIERETCVYMRMHINLQIYVDIASSSRSLRRHPGDRFGDWRLLPGRGEALAEVEDPPTTDDDIHAA